MTERSRLHEALLELGLEDWIPLPEALEAMKSDGLVTDDQAVEAISRALLDLLRADLIQVWSGPWQANEPAPILDDRAESMLRDLMSYSFETEASGRDRVYYANVQNIRA